MFAKPVTKKIGDCEASHVEGGVNCEIFLASHNMWLCAEHLAQEKAIDARLAEARQLQKDFKAADTQINIVTDILNAATVPIIELRQAIEVDDTIEPKDKEFTFVRMVQEHVVTLQEKLVAQRKSVLETENALKAWVTTGQSAVGKLPAELQAQFKNLRIDYVPAAPPKSVKTVTPTKSGKTFQKEEVRKWAAHYGVDQIFVQTLVVGQGKSPQEAAKHAARTLGLLKDGEV